MGTSFYKTKFYHNQKPFKSRKESIDDPNWIKLHLTLKNILGFVVFQKTGFFFFCLILFRNVQMLDSPSPGWMRRRQKRSGLVQKALRSEVERIAPFVTVVDIPQVHENLFEFYHINTCILNYVKLFQQNKIRIPSPIFNDCFVNLISVLFKINCI